MEPEAPTDEPTSKDPVVPAKSADGSAIKSNKSKRYAVFADGDVRIFRVASVEDHPVPLGVLIPLEGAPGFQTALAARAWLRRQSALPMGKRLLVAKVQALLELQETTQPVVRLTERPRVLKAADGRLDLPGQQLLPGS